ncbi:MAG: nucleotide exchange factor GrpE [Candidatus Paceibacterota bacterium]
MNNEEENKEQQEVRSAERETPNEERRTKNESEVDDVSFEDVNEEGEVDARSTIKKLREKIKKLEGEKQEYLDLSQRTRADYMNFKKEVDANRLSERKFSTKRFIEELLPVLDSYDMAKGNVEAWEKVDQNWRIGIEYIFGQLRTVLENEGVTQFGNVGDTFDPNLHESMEMVPVTNEKENDTLVRILQSGYRMHDTILRPARVHVGHLEERS